MAQVILIADNLLLSKPISAQRIYENLSRRDLASSRLTEVKRVKMHTIVPQALGMAIS